MTILELLQKYEVYPKLKEKFPGMVEFSREVEIIPWRDEFNVADKNPEIIEMFEFLDILLKNSMITEDEYRKRSSEVSHSYTSKTLGIAFFDDKQVSFRELAPKPYIALHELGHIYFNANDLLWNSVYGGGEVLMWLALQDKYSITEGHIRRFHALIEQIYTDPEGVHKLITDRIAHRLGVYPHLFTICLFAGYIPEFDSKIAFEIWGNLKSEQWGKFEVSKKDLFSFMQNLIEGLKHQDSFWVSFAEWLEIINE